MLFATKDLSFAHPGQVVLKFPDIRLDASEALLILGQSGSGKTTLLNLLAGLLQPLTGFVILNGTEINKLSGSALDLFRGKNIGIVFQKPHLLAPLSVKENLEMAHYLAKTPGQAVKPLLEELGIGSKLNAAIQTLSEGEAQRVSIARALVNSPKLILADEPTSSLDDQNTEKVIRLLKEQSQKIGAALIIVTHDQRVKNHISNFIAVKGS